MKELLTNREYFDSINSQLVDEIINKTPFRKELISLDFKYSEYLKFYLILTFGENQIPLLPNNVLYTSRYYWLKIYYHYYMLSFGEDAGIEQQIGTLVEEMCNNLRDYDWNILEEISKKYRKTEINNFPQ